MGSICVLHSLNALHADVAAARWEAFDLARGGLPFVGASGVPVAFTCHGMDYELFPWLRETLARYPSIEVLRAPYSNALIPLLAAEQQTWEMRGSEDNAHPVSFCGEFYYPHAKYIPTEAFLVLASQSVSCDTGVAVGETYVFGDDLALHDVIDYNGKIGLVMKGFEPILEAFYAFQRAPDDAGLTRLLDVIEREAAATTGTIIWPLDLEAPYVGSPLGAEIWRMVYEGICKRGIQHLFVSLKQVLETLRGRAVPTKRPNRVLGTKWTKYEIQSRYGADVYGFVPQGERQHRLLSLASVADAFVVLCRKLDAVRGATTFAGGKNREIVIRWSPDVFELADAARRALRGEGSFIDLATKRCNGSFVLVARVLEWARVHGL